MLESNFLELRQVGTGVRVQYIRKEFYLIVILVVENVEVLEN